MKYKKLGILLLLPVIAISITLAGCQSKSTNATVTGSVVSQSNEVSYRGQDGKTALELLKASHDTKTNSSQAGEMVTSIDGISQTEKEFWMYDVNGTQPSVGADQYQTKSNDTIHWQLKSF